MRLHPPELHPPLLLQPFGLLPVDVLQPVQPMGVMTILEFRIQVGGVPVKGEFPAESA
jgi:hypothetical protein